MVRCNGSSKALTDSTGLIRFDLEGTPQWRALPAQNQQPFGENKTYYSGVIVAEGPLLSALPVEKQPSPMWSSHLGHQLTR